MQFRIAVAALMVVAGVSGAQAQQSAMQRAIGQCMMTVGIGAIAGGLLGGMGGGRNAGSGAVIGAAVGAGSCAVLMQVAAAEDQRRIAEAERRAVAANASSVNSFRTTSGRTATVTTRVTPAPAKPSKSAAKPSAKPPTGSGAFATPAMANPSDEQICRISDVRVQVQGEVGSSTAKTRWCRNSVGEWAETPI